MRIQKKCIICWAIFILIILALVSGLIGCLSLDNKQLSGQTNKQPTTQPINQTGYGGVIGQNNPTTAITSTRPSRQPNTGTGGAVGTINPYFNFNGPAEKQIIERESKGNVYIVGIFCTMVLCIFVAILYFNNKNIQNILKK